MTNREKVLRAVNHEPGPIPIDFGGTSVSGIHCSIVEGLRGYYGLEPRPVKIIDPYQMLGLLEDDLLIAMGIDVKPMWNPYTLFGFKNENYKEFRTNWNQTVLVPEKFITKIENGKTFIYACGDERFPPCAVMPESGYFFDSIIRGGDVDDDTLTAEDNLEEFGEIGDDVLAFFEQQAKLLKNRDFFTAGSIGGTAIGDIALVTGPMLKEPKGIRDVEEWYISTITRTDLLHEIFEKQTDIAVENLKKVNAVAGDLFDAAVICGTDFGTQISTFCSAETYQSLYLPYHKKVNDWIHQNTGWKTFKHSCGAVSSFYSYFIEAGFDIINPVQWTATGMEKENLKKLYGDRLVFWGGGVDTQKTLPFGTVEQVKAEVMDTCNVFSKNGGFVFNTIHNIQAKTPVENVAAMIETVHEFNKKEFGYSVK